MLKWGNEDAGLGSWIHVKMEKLLCISFLDLQSQTDLQYHLGREMCVRTRCREYAMKTLNRYFQIENTAVKEIAEKS